MKSKTLDVRDFFHRFALKFSELSGSPVAFALALSVLVFWALSGPLFGFSDTWQLIVNTATTIVTFLMVFFDSEHAESRRQSDPLKAR
jgi:low affinity Fe/Cu permease